MKYALAIALSLSLCFGLVTESFRYQSTAYIWEDDYDLLFDPARIPEIEGSRLWTGLANYVTGSEELFSNASVPFFFIGGVKGFGDLYPAGVYDRRSSKIAQPTGIDTLCGEANIETIDWILDDQGDPIYRTVDRTKATAYDAYVSSDFYLAVGTRMNDLRLGLGFMKQDSKNTFTDPADNYGNEYFMEDIDDDSIYNWTIDGSEGDHIYTDNEKDVIFSAWMDKDNYSVGLTAEYAMLDNNHEAIITGFDNSYPTGFQNDDFTEQNMIDSVVLPQSGSRIEAELKCFYNYNDDAQGRFYVAYFTQSLNYGDDAMTLDYSDNFENYYDEVYDTSYSYMYFDGGENMSGFRVGTKQLFDITDRFRFGFGFFFGSTSTTVDSLVQVESTYVAHAEEYGDTLNTDYFTANWGSDAYAYDVDGSVKSFMIPVGVEFNISDPIVFRMGVEHTLAYRDFTTRRQLVDHLPHTYYYEDETGYDTTYIDTDYEDEDATILDKSTSSTTNYYYGIGWRVNNNLQIDFMNFNELVDLADWRLSATFIFD
jgi:hypothetical protein